MKRFPLFTMVVLLLSAAGGLHGEAAAADGGYVVGRDSRGMYLQTDRDGGWTIPREDQNLFSPGERGTYTRGEDPGGRFIRVGDKVKLYLDAGGAGRPSTAGGAAKEPGTVSTPGETRVVVKGNQVLVPVLLGHAGREIEVLLLLDTGASITTIDRAALKKLPIETSEKARLLVPGGQTVDADLVRLGYLKVGPHKRAGLEAAVIDHRGPAVDYQGLLGMNFLKDVTYRLDLKRRVIRWQ
jgi:predicted aspartyl protease